MKDDECERHVEASDHSSDELIQARAGFWKLG
jgi:hypothetical protein